MHLLMLTSSCDPTLKEEGFISDWILALAEKVDILTLITLTKPTIKLPANVFAYSLTSSSKMGKVWQIGKILIKSHKRIPIDEIFCNMYDFLGVISGLFSRIFNIDSVFWYAGGIRVPFFSLTTLAFWLNRKIATCSNQEKVDYQQMFKVSSKKIKVIGHGINKKRFENKKLVKKDSIFRIGYCCRLSLSKNIKTLLSVFSNKLESKQSIKLRISLAKTEANPTYFNKLKSIVSEINNKSSNLEIQLLTDINYANNVQFYQKLDLYVHPSFQTSIDKAAVEAGFAGVPVLLSQNGFGELFQHNKDIVFDPNDGNQLGLLINKYIKSKELREDNRKIVLSKFKDMDLSLFVERLLNIFRYNH